MIEIYDCTLRDGGYINNWKFKDEEINGVYKTCNDIGIPYVEVGYLDKIKISSIEKLLSKIIVMVDYNKKSIYKFQDGIDGFRVAGHKKEIESTIRWANELKQSGYISAIQVMGITNYSLNDLDDLRESSKDAIDILTIADSNGSLRPFDIKSIINRLKDDSYKLGFHSHNNLQLSLINSIIAMQCGANIIDCTFNGIGRGSGNLPTELFMSYMNKYYNTSYNIYELIKGIEDYIYPYKKEYNWGYNIPTMLSGIEKVHPYYGRDADKLYHNEMFNKIKEIGDKSPMTYKGKRKVVCIIPSRYKSTRFPGKSLALISGIPMIKRVYNNALNSNVFDNIYVATDDNRIASICKENDINYILTSSICRNGTDRLYETTKEINADLYVNLQGDEPLITSETIKNFVNEILNYGEINREAFNGITRCDSIDIYNTNIPKIVSDVHNDMLYMSRNVIPGLKTNNYSPNYYKELGLHAYTKRGLELYSQSKVGELEKSEELEFLRFIENGIPVKLIDCNLKYRNHAVDIPEDISIVEELLRNYKIVGDSSESY